MSPEVLKDEFVNGSAPAEPSLLSRVRRLTEKAPPSNCLYPTLTPTAERKPTP